MMYSLATTYTRELEIRKSRFIAYAIPVDDRDAAPRYGLLVDTRA